MANEILNPLNIKMFVKDEVTAGTLIFPVAADGIVPASYPVSDRNVSYTDSPEIRASLNMKDQIKDKDAAGSFNFNMLLRPNSKTAKVVDAPMGSVAYKGFQGKVQSYTAGIDTGIDAVVTSITFDTLVGDTPPDVGVIKITEGGSTEAVKYTGITWATTTSGTFTGCTRDYDGAGASAFTTAATIEDGSKTYRQQITRGTFSFWYEMDEVVYGMAGCTVSGMNINPTNKGYPTVELSGGFMTKVFAGQGTLNGAVAASADLIMQNGETEYFKAGARIYNKTTDDDKSGVGYEILSIDAATHKLTIDTAVSWSSADEIVGFLPTPTVIGSTLASEDTVVKVDTTIKKPTSLSITNTAPIQYIEDEITSEAISEYVAGKRTNEVSVTMLMRNSELAVFNQADSDTKRILNIQFGDGTMGGTVVLYYPRCTVQVPKVSTNEPVENITFTMSPLDTDKEDAFFICFI
jgi:hypothetical protein